LPLDANHHIAEMIDAALDWWRGAGVDCDFADAPLDWLAAGRAPEKTSAGARPVAAPVEPAPPPPSIGGDRATWPATLADFAPWWLSEPSLAPASLRRVPPAGPLHAALMVLVAMPEEVDEDRLLSGRSGKLLDAFLAAAGLDRAAIYVASALPARVALPDWADLGQKGLADILARHVALVAPQRLVIFGKTDISTLTGNVLPQNGAGLRGFNHEGGSVPAIDTYDLETLLLRPGLKSGLWDRWLDWTGIQKQ